MISPTVTPTLRNTLFTTIPSAGGIPYTDFGRVLDYSTQVGPFTIVDKSGEGNTATLYSGRGLTMDAVGDTVTYATGYSSASRTATLWGRFNTTSPIFLAGTVGGFFSFVPTATGVWEELTSTATVEGDLIWGVGSDFDIGDLRVGTEHWTHNDWSNPAGNTSNGKTIVDSGPNGYHGVCTGCSGFTGEGIDPEFAGIVGYDDAQWFNGTDTQIESASPVFPATADFDETFEIYVGNLSTPASYLYYIAQASGASASLGLAIAPTSGYITLVVSGAVAVQSSASHYGEHLTVRLARVGTTFEMFIGGASEGTHVSAASIDQVSTLFGANPQIAGRNTIGIIQGDSVTGTPSGTFVTVGQKRATIPQTADRNWNKYTILGAEADNDWATRSYDALAGDLSLANVSAQNAKWGCVIPSGLTGDTVIVRGTCTNVTSSPLFTLRRNDTIRSATTTTITATGDFEIELTATGAYDRLYVSEGSADMPSSVSFAKLRVVMPSGNQLVTASDANDQIDALGNAILEPRLNTQQLNLFGDGEYSRTPDSASLDLTTAATWEMWGNFYGHDTSTNRYIFSKYESAGNQRSWAILKTNSSDDESILRINFGSGSGSFQGYAQWMVLSDKVQQVVITYNAGSLLLYLDGALIGAPTSATTIPTSLFVGTAPVTIGSLSGAVPYAGLIGSAKIYNRALTADEVLTNYDTQKSLYGL